MDILTILITIILLFLFPLGQLLRIDIGNGVALNPLDIGVGILFISACLGFLIKRKSLPSFFWPLGGFIIVGLLGLLLNISQLSSNEFLISLLYLLRFVAYSGIGLGVFLLSSRRKAFLRKILLIAGGIVVIAGYIQYFFFPSLSGLLYEGWDPHLYRMFSTFLDPNFAGVFFVLYFLLVFHNAWNTSKSKEKTIYIILSILSFLAGILSFSRGAYIVLGISVLVYLFLKGYKKIALAIPFGVILVGFLFTFLLPYGEEKNLLRTQSTHARLVSVQTALTIFLKNPIFGVGFNSYRYAQHRYHLDFGFNWEDTHSGAGANNSLAFVLATSGILGSIFYCYFWFIILKKSFKDLKTNKNGIFLFCSFIALLISSLFENTLFYPSLMVWMWILIGLTG